MLKSPARNASAIPSPAAISGVANPMLFRMGATAPAKLVAVGSNTPPWNSETYAPETAVHIAENVSDGRPKK